MTRGLIQTAYCVRTALRGLMASPVTSGVAVVTIGVTLVLVGAFGLLLRNMDELLDEFGDDLRVTAYLQVGISDDQQRAIAVRVSGVEGVERVEPVTAEQALARFRATVGGSAALLEGLDTNPLPASLEISLMPDRRSASGLSALVAAIEGMEGVEDLTSGREWVEGYLRAVAVVRSIGLGLGIILALATLLIVANTIRLGVYARRDELEILSLVGGSRSFVRTPFLLEGVLQGAAGGTVALALLFALYSVVLPGLEFSLEMVVGSAPRFFSASESLMLIGAGAGLGLVGSAAALTGEARP